MESEGGSRPQKGKPARAGKASPKGKSPPLGKTGSPASGSTGKASPAGKPPTPPTEESKRRNVLGLRIAIVAIAAIAVVLGVLIAGGGDDEEEVVEEPATTSSRIVSPAELRSIAAVSPTPIYWAGERPDTEIELTEESDGFIYVRYLDEGAEVGQDQASFLTIGNYPRQDPAGELAKVASRPGAVVRDGEDGLKVIGSRENPYSVYFASPDNTVQVEVYDPAKGGADLVLSGEVEPAG